MPGEKIILPPFVHEKSEVTEEKRFTTRFLANPASDLSFLPREISKAKAKAAWESIKQWSVFEDDETLAELGYKLVKAHLRNKLFPKEYPYADVKAARKAFLDESKDARLAADICEEADRQLGSAAMAMAM